MPRFPLEEPNIPAPEPRYDLMTVSQLIAWIRALEARVQRLERAVDVDPDEPAQALGILIEEPNDV